MSKSKDAFRTISEVADWLETPAHVLRFWESKFTQVKPVKRAGGRRYYRPSDMQLLGGIKKLLHDDGLTIKGAQKLLREHGVKHVTELSQPLEDDLIEDTQIKEAAYEPDAQPEPSIDEPATVLSFPARTQAPTESAQTVEAPAPAAEEPLIQSEPPQVETVSTADTLDEVVAEPAQPTPPADPTPESVDNAPAFGSDALPAFLRRSPAPKEQGASANAETTETNTPTENAAPEREAPAKVTINPTARLEAVEADAPEQDASEPTPIDPAPSEPSPPAQRIETPPEPAQPEQAQPIFLHRSAANAPVPDAAPVETAASTPAVASDDSEQGLPESAPTLESTPEPAKPDVDVPPISQIAPELDSYEAPAGVLSAVPGARGLSHDLASQLSANLADLRALRNSMQSH